MILVTGATGTNGKAITRRLVEANQQVRVLLRTPDKAKGLGPVEVAIGDLTDENTLIAALQNVDRALLLTAVGEHAVAQVRTFLSAARQVRIRPHVVKFSGLGATRETSSAILQQHAETDEMVKRSGHPYTILQPNSFYQNMLWSAATIRQENAFYLALGTAHQSMVDVTDISRVAADALIQINHVGKTYLITGPQALSGDDMAGALSRVLGRTIRYVAIPPATVEDSLLKSGAPAWNAREVARLMAVFAEGRAAQVTDTVQRITGHAPRTFEQFVRDHAAAFTGTTVGATS